MNMDECLLSSVPLINPTLAQQQEEDKVSSSEMATPGILDIQEVPEQQPTGGAAQESLKSQTSLKSQASTQSPAKVNPVTLRVYTLKDGESHEMRFESGRLTNTQQIVSRIMEVIGIPKEEEEEAGKEPKQPPFSLWLTSKHLQLQLKSYHLPCKLFKRWKDLLSQYTTATFEAVCNDEPILSFQRNAFFSLKEERSLLKKQDPNDPQNHRKSIDLLYHEAVFNSTRSRYPLPVEDIHTLAGLQAAVKCAEKGTTNLTISEVQSEINTFYPSHMHINKSTRKISKLFKQKSVENNKTIQGEFSKSFQDAVKKCKDPHQLKILYLQLCWHKSYYGSVFFKGVVEKPFQAINLLTTNEKQVVLAINTECVHLMSASVPSDVLLFLTYDQLSWEFQPAKEEGEDFFSSLLLEFDSIIPSENKRVSKRIEIFSRQAPMMDAMIARCVQCIDKQEEKLRQQRLKEGNQEYLEYCIKTHDHGDPPRVQKQELNYKENKLQCTVLTPDGEFIGEGFTISKALKKKRKSKDEGASESSRTHEGHDTMPLATSEGIVGATEMERLSPGGNQPEDMTITETTIVTNV